jgi:signal transduction histidine kinase
MFRQARWRLTLWFAGTAAMIVGVIGFAVFASARAALFDGVNDDLEARAQREVLRPLAARAINPEIQGVLQIATAGGYFYAITREDGTLLQATRNVEEEGLASAAELTAADGGPRYIDTKSSDGDDLRVYVRPIETARAGALYLQVGRSTEPERQALRRLLLILLAGGGAGLGLALASGYWLSGLALRPIKTTMEQQQRFVADASHELRTPLALIRANAEILKREGDKPVATNITSVDDIIGETDRLAALVTQMLTLARSDGPVAPQEFVPVSLGRLAADTAREMRLLAEAKGITIEVTEGTDPVLPGDPVRLRELLTILLDNSLKYSDAGTSVAVEVTSEGETAVLRVSDAGHGIAVEALPRIFERFYRADKARSRESGGSGLGLSIARWIAETHGGTIEIESTPGQGTTVTVRLPLAAF